VETTYGFPRTNPSAALAAADELSRRYRESMRRLQGDNTIDLVCLKSFVRREFDVYRIKSDGSAELVDHTSMPFIFLIAAGLMATGIALFAETVIGVVVRRPEHTPIELDVAAVGFMLAVVGVLLARPYELRSFVQGRFGTDEGWLQVTEPTTWSPSSALQLKRVERIAFQHGGRAWVRTVSDGTAEVFVKRFFRTEHYRVYHDGAFVYLDAELYEPGEWHLVQVEPEPSDS
jgi:hypothetical protein